jgi:hypothetical protein
MDPVAEIKRLYYQTTRATIARDLAKAVDLLTSIESEDERERVAVFMDGLSQMRSEWAAGEPSKETGGPPSPGRPAR